jgi:hypothetical protein
MISYWINHWIALACSLVLGGIIGYLYREKELFDRKKGEIYGRKTGKRKV